MQSGTPLVDDLEEDASFKEHVAAAIRLSNLREKIASSQATQPGAAIEDSSSAHVSHTDSNSTGAGLPKEDDRGGVHRDLDGARQTIKPPHKASRSSKTIALQQSVPPASANRAPVFQIEQPQHRVALQNQQRSGSQSKNSDDATRDPMIYPGVYAPSGIDMMSILIRVYQRPSPQFNLGFIDSACALTLCTMEGDMPIIYASDAFLAMTGYSASEVSNRNCRFLQSPLGFLEPGAKRDEDVDPNQLWYLKQKVHLEETQMCLINFRKGGAKFENLLTTIPLDWGDGRRYIVGFQASRGNGFG